MLSGYISSGTPQANLDILAIGTRTKMERNDGTGVKKIRIFLLFQTGVLLYFE